MGHSYGSLVAETMARRLEQFGVKLPGRFVFQFAWFSFLLLIYIIVLFRLLKTLREPWCLKFEALLFDHP